MFIIDTYYLVDYENVHNDGLKGCKELKNTDHVLIFFTDNASKINMKNLSGIISAEIRYIEVPPGKQSADIHIGSYLGYLIGNNKSKIKIIIVSKDSDFDNLIKFWSKEADLCRRTMIEGCNTTSNNSKTTNGQETKMTNGNKCDSSQTKTRLNTDIQKAMSSAGYDNEVISTVAKLVVKRYGKENFKGNIHEDIRKLYGNFDEIYKDIKDVLKLYS